MAAAARIVWTQHPRLLAARTALLSKAFSGRVDRLCRAVALSGEARAKADAPWTNRTGAARSGLAGASTVAGGSGEITISHGVEYGIWLELANQGRFAVIPQTLQVMVTDLEAGLSGLLGRVA